MKRTQEKNAVVLQNWFRKLEAQKTLGELAKVELATLDARLHSTHNRLEMAAFLLRYLRLTVVAFFDSAHRNVDILVDFLSLFHFAHLFVMFYFVFVIFYLRCLRF
jgi:hypothetical protein